LLDAAAVAPERRHVGAARFGRERQRLDFGAGAHRGASAHDLHRPVHRTLVELLQFDRHFCRAFGEIERALLELVKRKRARRKSPFGGLAPGHRIARQHQLHGAAHADKPGMILHVRRAHQPHRRITDLRVVGDIDDIAGGCEFGAAGQAIAVHLRDHGFCQIPDREPALDDMPRPLARPCRRMIGLIDRIVRRQIVPCGKARTGAAQDRDRDVAIAVSRFQNFENFGAQPVVQRVALFRTIQGDAPDPRPRLVDENMLIRHRLAPPDLWPVRAALGAKMPEIGEEVTVQSARIR
jgi:hypothetical protein